MYFDSNSNQLQDYLLKEYFDMIQFVYWGKCSLKCAPQQWCSVSGLWWSHPCVLFLEYVDPRLYFKRTTRLSSDSYHWLLNKVKYNVVESCRVLRSSVQNLNPFSSVAMLHLGNRKKSIIFKSRIDKKKKSLFDKTT